MRHNKGCIVSINLHTLHHDETYWKDPQVFRPERHLTSEGPDGSYQLIKTDYLLPFSAGKWFMQEKPGERNELTMNCLFVK